jgi:uncharacterized protein
MHEQNTTELQKQLEKRVKKYRSLTEKALDKIKIKLNRTNDHYVDAAELILMSKNYFRDADYFEEQGELLLALAAYSYAHAWLDAGVKIGWLDGQGDDQLFTLP